MRKLGATMLLAISAAFWAQSANRSEKFALDAARAVAEAQQKYVHAHSELGYACGLADLQSAGLIDAAIASGKANGYKFDLRCPGKAVPKTEFEFVAKPADFAKTGGKTFCTTQRAGVLYSNDGQGKTCLSGNLLVK